MRSPWADAVRNDRFFKNSRRTSARLLSSEVRLHSSSLEGLELYGMPLSEPYRILKVGTNDYDEWLGSRARLFFESLLQEGKAVAVVAHQFRSGFPGMTGITLHMPHVVGVRIGCQRFGLFSQSGVVAVTLKTLRLGGFSGQSEGLVPG